MRRRLAVLALAGLAAAACSARPKGPGPMRVVAGNGTEGFADGTGALARFRKPIRLAAFGDDSVVVADIFNHAIREVRLDGRVRTIVGGPDRKGYRDGPAEEAQIASPHGVGVSPDGVIAVAEAANHTIRLLTPARSSDGTTRYTVSTLAGASGQEGDADGPAAEARFRSPHAAIFDRDSSLVVPGHRQRPRPAHPRRARGDGGRRREGHVHLPDGRRLRPRRHAADRRRRGPPRPDLDGRGRARDAEGRGRAPHARTASPRGPTAPSTSPT